MPKTMPEETVESPAHLEMRHALRHMALSIKDNGVDEFNLKQLKNLNIRLDTMVLDESSPHKPSYFAPYPSHLTPDADNEALGGEYNGIDDENDFSLTDTAARARTMKTHLSHYIYHCHDFCKIGRSSPWTSKCPAHYPFTGLDKDMPPGYECCKITDLVGYTQPHVKAVMLQSLIASDTTILRGELFPILMIMITQFWRARYAHHMVSPVLLISLMGLKARLVEAYFKDQTLVLRPSKMIDFSHGNDAGFKTLVQWWLGPPIGDTVGAS